MIQRLMKNGLCWKNELRELQGQIQRKVEKIDTNREYRLSQQVPNCEELTDTHALCLIDRVEVHEATGGRTVYRQQNIDIYFNFIGNTIPC